MEEGLVEGKTDAGDGLGTYGSKTGERWWRLVERVERTPGLMT